jgi:hypothetical protein
MTIVKRTMGKNNTAVNLTDNTYATLCTVTITGTGGEVLVQGHAVMNNIDYSTASTSKNNIVVRSAIRILTSPGHHTGVVDGGVGPAVDVLNVVSAQWLTVQPILYDLPPSGSPITYEVAAVTSYHPYYGSGKLVGNNASNPCYITVTEFSK